MTLGKLYWWLLAAVLFALGASAIVVLRAEPATVPALSHVQDDTGTRQPLPLRWSGQIGEISTRQYTFEFTRDPGQDAPLYLYIPYFEQRLELRLNGVSLTARTRLVQWKGPLSSASALTQLPQAFLREGRNRIDISITTGPVKFGALSRLYLGSEADLAPYFQRRSFVEHDLKIVVFGMQAFLALSSIVLVAARSNKARFAWLGVTMLTSCLFSVGNFADAFPAVLAFVPWSYPLMGTAAIGMLGFVTCLAGCNRDSALAVVAIAAPVAAYVLVLGGVASMAAAVLWIVLPIAVTSLTIALVLLVRQFWRAPSADLTFLMSGLLLLIGAVLHDQFLRLGYLRDGVLIAQPTRLLTLIGITIFLMLHLARITRELDRAAHTLSARLKQREAELATVFERERALAEKQASQSERNRIMAELHDGVAGHLTTIVALSDVNGADRRAIQTVARHALAELRMVIDALVMPEGDLRLALASLRDRSFEPLTRLGIETDWSMVRMPEVNWLTPQQTLSVLRILQEAISNAVRHGAPKHMRIKGQQTDDGQLALTVENTGGLAFVPVPKAGHYGLGTMAARAQELGGHTSIEPRPDGAVFTLVLPVNGPEPR